MTILTRFFVYFILASALFWAQYCGGGAGGTSRNASGGGSTGNASGGSPSSSGGSGSSPSEFSMSRSFKSSSDLLPAHPVSKKYVRVTRKGNQSSMRYVNGLHDFLSWKKEKELMEKTIRGPADPKFIPVIKILLTHGKYRIRRYRKLQYRFLFNVTNSENPNLFDLSLKGHVLWNVPGGVDRFGSIVASGEKLNDIGCEKASDLYRGLWVLGGSKYIDGMIKGFENERCRNNSQYIAETFPRLNNWRMTEEQKKAVLNFCVEKVLPKKIRIDPVGCILFLGRIGTKNEDALEFLKQYASGRSFAALRALARIGDKDSIKIIKKKARRYLAAKMALAEMGNKKYLGMMRKMVQSLYDKKASDRDERMNVGTAKTFMKELSYYPGLYGVLRSDIRKAYSELKKTRESEFLSSQLIVLTAAMMAQRGDRLGVPELVEVFRGRNNTLRRDAMEALGIVHVRARRGRGPQESMKFGPNALQREDGQAMINAVKKRYRFLRKDRDKKNSLNLIFEIHALLHPAAYGVAFAADGGGSAPDDSRGKTAHAGNAAKKTDSKKTEPKKTKPNANKSQPNAGENKSVIKPNEKPAPGETANAGKKSRDASLAEKNKSEPADDRPKSTKQANKNVVKDSSRRLAWMKCHPGQVVSGSSCSGIPRAVNWLESRNYCREMSQGRLNWRLPSREELQSLLVKGKIDAARFPGTQKDVYWTSSDFEQAPGTAVWVVDFSSGATYIYGKNEAGYVRCVSSY